MADSCTGQNAANLRIKFCYFYRLDLMLNILGADCEPVWPQ